MAAFWIVRTHNRGIPSPVAAEHYRGITGGYKVVSFVLFVRGFREGEVWAYYNE